VNVPLLVAGSLALAGAAIHGGAGEVLVVRRLPPAALPSTRFGGPGMTKAMIAVTWHLTTMAFLVVGATLVLSGSVLHGDAARAVGVVAAAAATGFAAVMVGLGAATTRSVRPFVRHPGPLVFVAIAALAWAGIA